MHRVVHNRIIFQIVRRVIRINTYYRLYGVLFVYFSAYSQTQAIVIHNRAQISFISSLLTDKQTLVFTRPQEGSA
jgi:hypothetical protein